MFWQRIGNVIYEVAPSGRYSGRYAFVRPDEPIFAKRLVLDRLGRATQAFCG